jgi:ribosomal protein S18 acetylase RimI-like enzyme
MGSRIMGMETFDFRLADENDLDFIRRLSAMVFSKYGTYDEIVLGWLVEPEVITVVIAAAAEPQGFAMVTLEREKWFEPRRAHLLAIGIYPGQQRKGIGSALLAHMEEVARRYGVEEMLLWTAVDNQQALSFFQKAGFGIVGSEDRYYPRGQSALALAKKLSQ